MNSTLRAFKHANFRIYFAGQSFSLLGTWVQQIAISWLIYRLTQSPMLLGTTGFLSQIPILVLAPVAGLLSDRFDRKTLLLITQALAMLQAFILAFLVWTDRIEVRQILALSLSLGVITAFEIPSRQSLMSGLVEDKSDLPNAIALNSLLVNSARLIGPALAGFLITFVNETLCFVINGLSYFAVIGSLLFIRIRPATKTEQTAQPPKQAAHGLRTGVLFAMGNPPMRSLLILLALASFMVTPYLILMPIFAAEVFKGSANTLGMLLAPAGFGAILGNLYLASRKHTKGLCKILVTASISAGSALIMFSQSRVLEVSMMLMILVGFSFIVQVVASNMILQTLTDEDKRGRVMSLYTMAYMGMIPLGSMVAGQLATHIGAPNALLICGVCCVICGGVYALRMASGAKRGRTMCREQRDKQETGGVELNPGLKQG